MATRNEGNDGNMGKVTGGKTEKKDATGKISPGGKRPSNRKPKRKAKNSGGRPPGITGEKYNQMYMAYRQKQTVKHVSDTVGCSYETAKFYVNGPGRPTDGMEPIRERYLRAERARQETQDDVEGERIKKRLRFIDALLNLAEGETILYQKDLKIRMEQYEKDLDEWSRKPIGSRGEPPRPVSRMSLVAVTKVADKMGRMEQYMKGGHDQMIGISDPSARFERYTEEELLELAMKGRIPDHDRSANNLQNSSPGFIREQ